jgi:hypothetical protein
MLITVDTGELHGLLTDLRSACTGPRLDGFAGIGPAVTPHTDGQRVLVGISTDRYRAAMAYLPAHQDDRGEPSTGRDGPGEHLLDIQQVKSTLAALKGQSGPTRLHTRPEGTLRIAMPNGECLALQTADLSRFPRIARLMTMPGTDVDHRDSPARLDPRWLESFCAIAKRRSQELHLHRRRDAQAVTVTIGERYRALLTAARDTEPSGQPCPVFNIPTPPAAETSPAAEPAA